MPRFRDQSHAELISQTRKLATTFRFLQHEAILNGRVYRLNFDLDQQRYFVTSADEGDELGELRAGDRHPGARRRAARQPADRRRRRADGRAASSTKASPSPTSIRTATSTPTVVHLDNGQEVYTLYVDQPLTGRAYVASGYLDLGAGR